MSASPDRRAAGVLLAALLLLAPVVPACNGDDDGGAAPDAVPADVFGGDAPTIDLTHDEGAPDPGRTEPVDPAPPAELELPVTKTPEPELFADVGEGGIIYMRSLVDEARRPEGQTSSCLDCLYCDYCKWQILQYDTGTGKETIIATENRPRSRPRIYGRRVVWLLQEGQNVAMVHDLETSKTKIVTIQDASWLYSTPMIYGGKLYWQGYVYGYGNDGLVETDIETGQSKVVAQAYMSYQYWGGPSWASNLGRPQPFTIAGGRAYWVEWTGIHQGIRMKDLGSSGQPATYATEDGWDYMHVVASDDALAWKAYESELGCYDSQCDLALRYKVGEQWGSSKLSEGVAAPSRYADMVVAGSNVYWIDFRNGPYAIYRRDVADSKAGDERLTSSEAVIGAHVGPSVHGPVLVWMDYRNGNWDVYRKLVD